MASWLPPKSDPSAENLSERLARGRDLAGPRRSGDGFGQGGWHREFQPLPAPEPPGRFLVLLPLIVLALVSVAVTAGLFYAEGRI